MAAVHHLRRPPCTTGNGTGAPSSAESVHHEAGINAPWPAECLHHQAGVRIHIAKTIARVDNLYWDKAFSMDEYTESERVFINYIARGTKQQKPVHNLEYFLDIAGSPHMRTREMIK